MMREKHGIGSDGAPFSLRIEAYTDEDDFAEAEVRFVRNLPDTESVQRAYIHAREKSGLGASQFLPGEVFDRDGAHVGRISYNGRLWEPVPLAAGMTPLAEAPEMLAWMFGSREDVLQDRFIAGPDSEPDFLALHMKDGQILIGKARSSGEVKVVQEKISGELVDVPGGLDGLRPEPGLEP